MKRILTSVIVVAFLLLGGVLSAQEAPPPYIQISVEDIKPDKVSEYVALIKELNAAVKEAGAPGRTVWRVRMGPRARFYTVRPVQKLSEYDSEGWLAKAMPDAGERANWINRITSVTVRREVRLHRTYPDLSIPWEAPPPFIVLHLPINHSGRMGDYIAFLRDELIPAYKAAGVKGVMVSRLVLGGETRTWGIARGFDKWAEIEGVIAGEGPLAEALGAKAGVHLATQQRYILALRDDLSFSNQ